MPTDDGRRSTGADGPGLNGVRPAPRSGEVLPRPLPQAPRPDPVAAPLQVTGAELRFLDPPRPGAHASLAVSLRNSSDLASRPLVIGIPAAWFDGYAVIGAIPPVIDDRVQDDGFRYFEFPGVDGGEDAVVELHVSSVGEDADAPVVRLSMRDAETLGEVRAGVVAPPGPVRALSMPRLGIRTRVVGTAWEPPPFVAGQISATSALGQGNSVLIGHRGGLAGDVFARLQGARLGDEVVATSGGAELRYTVSEIRMLPGSDSTPITPTETPRLTLMTCVGAWNPLTGDYSHRLWVIAEPRDLALTTLASTAAQAGRPATTSDSPSDAARAKANAALARAALAVLQAERR